MKIKKVLSVLGKIVLAIMACLALLYFAVWIFLGRDIPPPDTSDLVVPRVVVADADNAYTYFKAATNTLYWPSDIYNFKFTGDYYSGKSTNEAQVAEMLLKNAETFRLVEKGVSCRVYQEPVLTNGLIADFDIGKRINIARALACRIHHAQLAGNMTEAVDTCSMLLRFGSMTQQDSQNIVETLCGNAILTIGLARTRQLSLCDGVGQDELRQLAKQLDDMVPVSQGFIHGSKDEYQMMNFYVSRPEIVFEHRFFPSFLFKPNLTRQKLAASCRQAVRNETRHAIELDQFERPYDGAEGQDFWHKARIIFKGNFFGERLLMALVPAFDWICNVKCKSEGDLFATRLIVATRRYELAHDGKLPENLQALVPTYLAAVPDDPFDGKPFRYSPEKKIVYSVGKNLVDDGGSVERLKPSGHYDPKDLVYALDKETDVKLWAAMTAAYEKRSGAVAQ